MKVKYIIWAIVLLTALGSNSIAQNNILILAPDEFVDELQTLKRYKNYTGRKKCL